MGWTISVGQAGSKGKHSAKQANRQSSAQALMLSVDVQGVAARVKVYPDAHTDAAAPAWQAQRVWQTVLSTLVGN
jgi:hypothetical protein